MRVGVGVGVGVGAQFLHTTGRTGLRVMPPTAPCRIEACAQVPTWAHVLLLHPRRTIGTHLANQCTLPGMSGAPPPHKPACASALSGEGGQQRMACMQATYFSFVRLMLSLCTPTRQYTSPAFSFAHRTNWSNLS